jgi:hypothetical protein
MKPETIERALSVDELKAVSGGQVVVCERTAIFSLIFMQMNVAKCENGQTISYPTFD